jgi:ribosomal protein L11 methyltransferase
VLTAQDLSGESLPAFEFATPGPLRERLCGLTMAGTKTGTFSLVVLDEMFPEGVLPLGSLALLVSSSGARLGIVEVLDRRTCWLSDVTWEMVASEGESDRSVAEWRRGHERFWSQFTDEIRAHTNDPHWAIADDTEVVYETYRFVRRLPAADVGRYPVVELVVDPDSVEWVSAELFELGCTGIEETMVGLLQTPQRYDSGGDSVDLSNKIALRAGFPSETIAAEAEAALDPAWLGRFEVIVGDDWLDAWRDHFEPVRVGRIVIAPSWRADDPDVVHHPVMVGAGSDDIVIWLDPGRSFGTGGHASTRLALSAMQRHELVGQQVLDVGCGSGVLMIAAVALGASSAHGVDVESAALAVTMENAQRHGVADRVSVGHNLGSDEALVYPMVVANILAPVLIELAPQIVARVASHGVLILAGLIAPQVDSVVAAFTAADPALGLAHVDEDGEWRGLTLQRATAPTVSPDEPGTLAQP